MAPDLVWISQPPSSALLRLLPSAFTTGGPATNIAPVSFVMIEKWVAASRAAPSPATLPRPSPTTGTRARLSPVWW